MDASEIVLTADGRQKLIEELEWREGEKNKEIIEHIKEARAFGDLSENAEYDAAKEEQAKTPPVSPRSSPSWPTRAMPAMPTTT